MKHVTPSLVKFKKLKRRLGLQKNRDVIGLLESLWLFTQREAPRGDIGRFDNETIAIELEWDEDPDDLVYALTETGWLDECELSRLVVHDWSEHAPRYLKGVVARKGGFVESVRSEDVANTRSATQGSQRTSPTSDTCVANPGFYDTRETQPNLTKPNLTKPNGSCVEADSRSTQPVDDPGMVFPVVGSQDQRDWRPTVADLGRFKSSYPGVAVEDEIRAAACWCHANPSRRKTPGGMLRFLNGWLSKEQNRSRGDPGQTKPKLPAIEDLH